MAYEIKPEWLQKDEHGWHVKDGCIPHALAAFTTGQEAAVYFNENRQTGKLYWKGEPPSPPTTETDSGKTDN